ncbi:transcriptional regulator [Mycolicibacterium insubricum]|uniref:Transcriptional regulator n=1 Tax=Mycolicibacterium insubricum TaxID=444597 RepID=A0A1X0CXT3_9MYCO|nr:helix-turn-helix transcriptional regulator [Mycolicibacterium insubricum]ORA64903.1 transcriptional regulator [Mycolicibacterium insubricum]
MAVLRRVSGLTLDEVCDLVAEVTGDRPTRGALSAIENGHRGASAQLISGLEHAYNLDAGSISTVYRPRNTPAVSEVA